MCTCVGRHFLRRTAAHEVGLQTTNVQSSHELEVALLFVTSINIYDALFSIPVSLSCYSGSFNSVYLYCEIMTTVLSSRKAKGQGSATANTNTCE